MGKTSNLTANVSDWWLNWLNRKHILPANVATLLRSISAKQLGDASFRPRPLTMDNFTNAELDALLRIAKDESGNYGTITESSYDKVFPANKPHADQSLTLPEYMSPARVVSTTLSQAAVSKENGKSVLHDTYDFNIGKHKVLVDKASGTFIGKDGIQRKLDELDGYLGDYMSMHSIRLDTPYGRLRNNAAELAHHSSDPDASKIKASIPLDDVEKRLGSRLGTYNIQAPMSRRDLISRGLLAGGLTGLPIGALAGAHAGLLISAFRKNKKNRLKTILLSSLTGAAISGLFGAAGGGLMAARAYGKFNKVGASVTDKKKKKKEFSYGKYIALPLTALSAIGIYRLARKASSLATNLNKLDRSVDFHREISADPVEDSLADFSSL